MLATVVEGDPKAPFSIATTPRCRGGHYSFPLIAPLYPWYVPYNTKCEARRYQVPFSLKVFGMIRPGIEPQSSGPLVDTLPTRPISWLVLIQKVAEKLMVWLRTKLTIPGLHKLFLDAPIVNKFNFSSLPNELIEYYQHLFLSPTGCHDERGCFF